MKKLYPKHKKRAGRHQIRHTHSTAAGLEDALAVALDIILEQHRALEYAECITITGERVSDELFARLRCHFTESQIVELTAVVALENFRSKFNVPLGIEAQGFCVLP